MARINVEQTALSDTRYKALARMLDLGDADHALGKMVRVWNECTERETYTLPCWAIEAIFDSDQAPQAVVDAELAEWVDDTMRHLRIRGTKGRIEWIGRFRNADKVRAGKVRAANANRDPHTGTFTSTPPAPSSKTKVFTSTPPARPAAPSPSPAPTSRNIGLLRKPHPPAAGFDLAWTAYPHHDRRSRKKESRAVWNRHKLDKHTDRILAWIAAMKQTQDWQRNNGAAVPGFQVWIKREDIRTTDPEPIQKPYLSGAAQATADAVRRRLEKRAT